MVGGTNERGRERGRQGSRVAADRVDGERGGVAWETNCDLDGRNERHNKIDILGLDTS